jgi:hypothetical protein
VLFVLHYHDGPISGLAVGDGTARYFNAPFRDDLDKYDDVFHVMPLDADEAAEAGRLFEGARVEDPACRDPSRRALIDLIKKRFATLLAANSPAILRCKPTFRPRNRGGAYDEYDVEWRAES